MKRIDKLERNQSQILAKIQAKLEGSFQKSEERSHNEEKFPRGLTAPNVNHELLEVRESEVWNAEEDN